MAPEPIHADTPATTSPPSDIFRPWLKWARILGCLPLAAGAVVLLLWVLTRNEIVELLGGILVVPLGILSILCGMVCLGIYIYLSWRDGKGPPIAWAVISTLGLFAINYPAKVAAVYATQVLSGMSSVVVANLSDKLLTNVRLLAGEETIKLKDVPPGASVRRSFVIPGRCTLRFLARHGGDQLSEPVAAYDNQPINLTISVDSSGELKVLYKRSE
jgi:hypothetical protein